MGNHLRSRARGQDDSIRLKDLRGAIPNFLNDPMGSKEVGLPLFNSDPLGLKYPLYPLHHFLNRVLLPFHHRFERVKLFR